MCPNFWSSVAKARSCLRETYLNSDIYRLWIAAFQNTRNQFLPLSQSFTSGTPRVTNIALTVRGGAIIADATCHPEREPRVKLAEQDNGDTHSGTALQWRCIDDLDVVVPALAQAFSDID